MIPRTLFSEEHDLFRDTARRFIEKEIVPNHAQWEVEGIVSRELWRAAGEQGLLCCTVPEEYGGPGGDFLHSVIVNEELARVGATGPAFPLHSDIIAPYLQTYGSEDQKKEWLPKLVSGETIMAIGMTEPAAGSDLQGIKTRADRDGNHFVLNGQKVWISNGQIADLYVIACKTNANEGAKGISLMLVEGNRAGFKRGKKLEKIGYKAQDTSELFFEDVRVPITNLLGQEGRGFAQLMQQLPQERLVVAIRCATALESTLNETIHYTKERRAFGRSISDFQNTRFKLAEIKTLAMVTRSFTDQCIQLHCNGMLSAEDAAAAKLQTTEALNKGADECLQLHGGYGYSWEYPVARTWADARMSRIAGGSSEIMKEIISRNILVSET
ncbi:MAG: acyl-CoA dehydrogenase [Rhodospirillaceae bacterium]|nr:acyl-CoA dehydrogenase [Rhodospirillaceae bacterium]|tara:strand:+ start:1180 stop:2331 length:1152 start_codon:yes stop_codon:yes gene_type:complete